MSKKPYILLFSFLLVALAGSVSAQCNWWERQTMWGATEGTSWHEPNNWDNNEPNICVWACIQGNPDCNITGAAAAARISVACWASAQTTSRLIIAPTATTIEAGFALDIGTFVDNLEYGTIDMYGGTVRTSTAGAAGLVIGGADTGLGQVYGIVNIYDGNIIVPKFNIVRGTVNIYGGQLWDTGTASSWTISKTYAMNKINIEGGTFRIISNRTAAGSGFMLAIADGRICGYNGRGDVTAVYTDGNTVCTAVPNFGRAWAPVPGNTADPVTLNPTLSWSPGEWVKALNEHAVYFGTSFADVNSGAAGAYQGLRDVNNYTPPGPLTVSTTYYWRIEEINEANAGSPWKGQVWQFKTLGGIAINPKPAVGATGVEINDLNLRWTAGQWAATTNGHRVFFGTDANQVRDANTSTPVIYRGQQTATSYPFSSLPGGVLAYDSNYFWRIDEVNSATVWKGDVWDFNTPHFYIVDNFDKYTDDIGLHVNWDPNDWPTCSAGTGTGVWVYDDGDDMRLTYDNNGTDASNDYYSEIRRDFGPAGVSFTVGSGAEQTKALALSFRGQATNQAHSTYDRMFVCLTDTNNHVYAVNHSDPNVQQNGSTQEWNIDLTQFSSHGVNLSYVRYLSVGFGKQCNYTSTLGGAGTVWFDDFRLYPSRCVASETSPFDLTEDCIVDLDDLDAAVADWLNTDANIILSPIQAPADPCLWFKFDDGTGTSSLDSAGDSNGVILDLTNPWRTSGGYDGSGYLVFNGVGGDMEIDPCLFADHIGENITISVWIKCDVQNYPQGSNWSPLMRASGSAEAVMDIWCPTPTPPTFPAGPQVHFRFPDGMGDGDPGDDLVACWNDIVQVADFTGRWHHWVFVKDGTNDFMGIYHNGQLLCYTNEANTIGEIPTPTQITVANYNQWASPSWAGGMDDMRIYNYALSPAEIGYLTTKGTGTIFLPLSSPADLYVETPNIVNFKDLAVFANNWLSQYLWP